MTHEKESVVLLSLLFWQGVHRHTVEDSWQCILSWGELRELKKRHQISHRLMLCWIPTNSNTRILGFGDCEGQCAMHQGLRSRIGYITHSWIMQPCKPCNSSSARLLLWLFSMAGTTVSGRFHFDACGKRQTTSWGRVNNAIIHLDDVIGDRIIALHRARGPHPEPDGTPGATRNGDPWLAPRFPAISPKRVGIWQVLGTPTTTKVASSREWWAPLHFPLALQSDLPHNHQADLSWRYLHSISSTHSKPYGILFVLRSCRVEHHG